MHDIHIFRTGERIEIGWPVRRAQGMSPSYRWVNEWSDASGRTAAYRHWNHVADSRKCRVVAHRSREACLAATATQEAPDE